jgi:4-alpha-glucanotransferase
MNNANMQTRHPLDRRRAGVLLHLTSLPGAREHGALGQAARRWIDLIADAGFTVWQTLPVGPPGEDGSPYFSRSVHAADVGLIDLEDLQARGWIEADSRPHPDEAPANLRKRKLLQALIGFENRASAAERAAYAQFLETHRAWLADDALFLALRAEHQGAPWWEWRPAARDRDRQALALARERHHAALEQFVFEQFLFHLQWRNLREHAHQRGVRLFGDIPIYVAHDSVEVWAHRENFQLDARGLPLATAGVPPDYFAADGQMWGNPLYDWPRMRANGFAWWEARIRTQLERFDLLRIDHFRGLESYWEIPAGARTAREGRWRPAEGAALLAHLRASLHALPLMAEDLGVITDEVVALRDRFALPGMRVLQFAFDGSPENPYLPHNHVANAIVYTGTHDNDTTVGWYASLDEKSRRNVDEYFGASHGEPQTLIRAAFASVARLAIVPLQDLLALGSEARMNTPATTSGNWQWRFDWRQIPTDFVARWQQFNRRFGRC